MTYKITFYAELNEDDVKAMNGCFYDAMSDAMDIDECWGLKLEEDDGEEDSEDGGKQPDLVLEEDAYELDMRTGDIKIDKQVFDAFEKDAYINIEFCDEEVKPVNTYIMRSEDDEYIYCEFLE